MLIHKCAVAWCCASLLGLAGGFSTLPRLAARTTSPTQVSSSKMPLDEDDELSRLIGKRDAIKRKKKYDRDDEIEAAKAELEAAKKFQVTEDSLDFDKLPDFKTGERKARAPSPSKEDKKASSREEESGDMLDFLAEYEDENELHIPNRIGFTTAAWGDTSRGFVSGGKLSKKMRREGKFVPGDLQVAYNTLLESGVSFCETSELFGATSRGQKLSAEHILGRCMEENDSFSPIMAGTFANAWSNIAKNGPRLGGGAVANAAKKSCSRMETSGVELYQVQSTFLYPGGRRALADGLAIAIDKGYCNYVGVENAGKGGMRGFARKLESRGLSLTSNQFEFSLTNRKAWKSGLIDACKKMSVIPLVRNPLDGGLASGKYTATNPSGGEAGASAKFPFAKLEKLQPLHSVQETVAERASTRVKRELRDVQERMRRYGPAPKINTDITTTQVAINYIIAKGAVPLCDVTDSAQAQEIIGCLGWSLSDDEVDMLDSAAALCDL